MGVTGTHTHYGVRLNDTVPTLIGSITRQAIATNSEVKGEATSGEIYRRFLSLYSQKIAPSFSTYAIASALGNIGVLGISLADLANGLDFFAQKNLDGSTRAGATSHRQFTFNAGILVPRRLSVEHGGDAMLEYEAVVIYDGTNEPLVITDSVTLPTGITDSERFAMAGMSLGGVTFDAKTQWSIDFGVDAAGRSADGEIYDTFASIRTVQSQLTVESLDVELLKSSNVPLTGKAGTHANSSIFLRKRADGDTFVADATEEHIELTVDGMVVPDDAFSSDGQSDGKVSFTMPLKFDGTNLPVVVDTAAAIP